jgi:glutathione S-transferase
MLKFYYTRLSINARRVWVTLLEKKLEFEPIVMKLNGDQFQPEFL